MIKIYSNNNAFLDDYLDIIEKDEIKNGLMIGLSKRKHKEKPFFVSSVIGDDYLLGLIAGRNMILASNSFNDQIYIDLVEEMEKHHYPGIIGEKEICLKYEKIYHQMIGHHMSISMNQRIYACEKINHYSQDIGIFRLAQMSDIDLLSEWTYDFELMIEGYANQEEINESLKLRIEDKILYVLEVNKKVVSMALRIRPLKKIESVGLVYTPKAYRNKGYASRVVEKLTELIIKDGRVACLYTDLSNPTSNSIYMKIGYKPYCDSMMMIKDI